MKTLYHFCLVLAIGITLLSCKTATASTDAYFQLLQANADDLPVILTKIDRQWSGKSAAMLLETSRLAQRRTTQIYIIALLQKRTGQDFGGDFKAWEKWLWKQPDLPDPDYPEFKARLYSLLDSRFKEYFSDTDNAKIRLDEIVWGGVVRDGIPPLNKPKMTPANEATFLEDSNVVFGVSINGDHRCYPKRILAWHEMFKDTIGGQSVCGAY